MAQQFAAMTTYHGIFRSCNRAFAQDPAERLDHWCGRCDKCCFIDLILSPFMDAVDLTAVFDGNEPLENRDNLDRFRTLIDLVPNAKPFECVGDVQECRAALTLAHGRPDRVHSGLLQQLAQELADDNRVDTPLNTGALLVPMDDHYIPERYAPGDLLARAR